MTRTRLVLSLAFVLASASLVSASENAAPPPDHQAAFERLKALVGLWKGHHTTADGPEMSVEYGLTGNGTALTERLFAGTSHEMLSVYFMERGELVLTHYCAMGNQPRMKLVSRQGRRAALRLHGRNQPRRGDLDLHPRRADRDPGPRPLRRRLVRLERGQAGGDEQAVHVTRRREVASGRAWRGRRLA